MGILARAFPKHSRLLQGPVKRKLIRGMIMAVRGKTHSKIQFLGFCS
jgi:hypothetical protein